MLRPLPPMTSLADLSDDAFDRRLREAVALPEVPAALTHAAVALWPATAAPGLAGLLRRLQAVLSVDSWAAAPTALGLRGPRSPTRQLLFSAEGCDIDLRISPAGEGFALSGQVLGPYESGTVALHQVPATSDLAVPGPRHTTLDMLGEFHLASVAGGRYQLSLQLGGDEIVLPPIEVGPDPA